MNILLLDNYDSFTWNLYDYLMQCHVAVRVIRNDAISAQDAASGNWDGLVISPGPGRPEDAGITMELIDLMHTRLPILGVCLGYQAIGAYFGASVVNGPLPVHGKTSLIRHQRSGLFEGIPDPTRVMRYHSLNIKDVPESLIITAETQDTGEPMALKHTRLPLCGVQFHPESILTTQGLQMLRNWVSGLH